LEIIAEDFLQLVAFESQVDVLQKNLFFVQNTRLRATMVSPYVPQS